MKNFKVLFENGKVQRNRMLAQRHFFWEAERAAARSALDILNKDVGYRALMNILGNYLCCTMLLWGKDAGIRVSAAAAGGLQLEKNLSLWGEASPTFDTMERWIAQGRKWGAEDCGELFRLFIGVVEAIGSLSKGHRSGLRKIVITSDNFKFSKGAGRYSSKYSLKSITGEEWEYINWKINRIKGKKIGKLEVFKKRIEKGGKGEKGDGIDHLGPRSRKTVLGALDRVLKVNENDFDSCRRFSRLLVNSSGGTNIHSIQLDSLCGALEWIYGLPAGADSSGTTAEVIAICELLSGSEDYKFLPKDELDIMGDGLPWYLGPVLSMVKAGHHTMLECAVAMALSDQGKSLKYFPGNYGALLPGKRDSGLYNDVQKCLSAAGVTEGVKGKLFLFKPPVIDSLSKSDDARYVSLLGGTIISSYEALGGSGWKNAASKSLFDVLEESATIVVEETTLGNQMMKIFEYLKKKNGSG